MKASKFSNPNPVNWEPLRTKERISSMLATYPDKEGRVQIACRAVWYMSRASTATVVYCSLVIQNHGAGIGKAGGGGYCKKSAALAEAIRRAGIAVDKNIAGVGEGACREALEAIARDICDVEGIVTIIEA